MPGKHALCYRLPVELAAPSSIKPRQRPYPQAIHLNFMLRASSIHQQGLTNARASLAAKHMPWPPSRTAEPRASDPPNPPQRASSSRSASRSSWWNRSHRRRSRRCPQAHGAASARARPARNPATPAGRAHMRAGARHRAACMSMAFWLRTCFLLDLLPCSNLLLDRHAC